MEQYIIAGLILIGLAVMALIIYDVRQEPNTNECYIRSYVSDNVIHKVIRRDTRWYISHREIGVFNNYNEAAAWQNKYCDNKVSLLDIK
jgi:hypothetical protein